MVRLVNISKGRVQQIDHKAPLISICDRYSTPAAIPGRGQRPLLLLEFFPADHAPEISKEHLMTEAKADAVIKFVEEQREAGHEVIYVNCGEGRVRSYSVCAALESLEGFHHDHANACIKQGILDRYTFNLLGDRIDAFEEARAEATE
ncbi:hypothetical protein D3C76_154640 [compost metagenome]